MKRAILYIASASMALVTAPGHAALVVSGDAYARAGDQAIDPRSFISDDLRRSGSWEPAMAEGAGAANLAFARALGRATGAAGLPAESIDAYAHLTSASLSQPSTQPALRGNSAREEDGLPAHLPEPASWVMMLLGFSALGFTLRRRPKTSARIRFS